ncbi:MAG: hypothetical protein COX77_05040 [Candidatus Komeilibacteria bacterium CG_4_10_14_0_2_um_filter_37_10]|uniref:Uncharacterized protein n=1 Tax=Candidatus Komeilibacteria bacterium CG_4_10_14_0_2_um_filter_37_10 TaxID=1974470 RepID=A0A2M7VDE7_9BACT|nr:MAG: hypothetical protein COX77_05040 [Candidatus Komeilibacteria bacterium CG_4_10_14_0_2_um_filter_37_10]
MIKVEDAYKEKFLQRNGTEVWRLVEIVTEYGRTESVRTEAPYNVEFTYVHDWKRILKTALGFDLGGDETLVELKKEYINRYGQKSWQQLFSAFKLILFHSALHLEGLHKMLSRK